MIEQRTVKEMGILVDRGPSHRHHGHARLDPVEIDVVFHGAEQVTERPVNLLVQVAFHVKGVRERIALVGFLDDILEDKTAVGRQASFPPFGIDLDVFVAEPVGDPDRTELVTDFRPQQVDGFIDYLVGGADVALEQPAPPPASQGFLAVTESVFVPKLQHRPIRHGQSEGEIELADIQRQVLVELEGIDPGRCVVAAGPVVILPIFAVAETEEPEFRFGQFQPQAIIVLVKNRAALEIQRPIPFQPMDELQLLHAPAPVLAQPMIFTELFLIPIHMDKGHGRRDRTLEDILGLGPGRRTQVYPE